MKNKTIILTLLLVFASSLKASVENSFVEANNMYKNGNYQEAIDMYQSILDGGYESAALYYNLGNAYFRTDNLGAAILNYERALQIDPSDKEIQQNLDYSDVDLQLGSSDPTDCQHRGIRNVNPLFTIH